MLLGRLSDLTPSVVDRIYNIDGAVPSERPTFLFLVGAPGSGKSSGHGRAIEAGLLPAGNYATVNMDMLLESLLPFRAASSVAHYLKQGATAEMVRFASISAYGSRRENLGLFKWYDDAHAALAAADPEAVRGFNRIRRRFAHLAGQEGANSLIDVNEAALERAIAKRVNVVYETTLSLTVEGRVRKVDALMRLLKKTPYRVVFYHITGSPANVAARIRARQEHQTPQEAYPFFRYVSTRPERVEEYIRGTAEAFGAVAKRYAKVAEFETFENPMDLEKAPAENRRTVSARRRRIMSAYAGQSPRRTTQKNRS